MEISIHSVVSGHQNIIQHLGNGEDSAWFWIALELADGGDLFDKIEADEGVPEDIAHFYFKQLINAVSWCHSKGVAHRDIKPENMLLTADGDLKLADFGLGTTYADVRTRQEKLCSTVCGSPPYIAPEIVEVGTRNERRRKLKDGSPKAGYKAAPTDLWSCAIVLFVLLAGNTPWDSPIPQASAEYAEFVQTNGRPEDELWTKIPHDVLSLVRGMLRIDPEERFSLQEIRTHPWFTRPNKYMDINERSKDSVALATRMMERLHIDFTAAPASQPTATEIDSQIAAAPDWHAAFAATQPETPMADTTLDWEAPPRMAAFPTLSASQPTTAQDRNNAAVFDDFAAQLSQDPSMSQFTSSHQIPISLTQHAKRFRDIAPAHSLARFYSAVPLSLLLGMLRAALHDLNVPTPLPRQADSATYLWVRTDDSRKQALSGNVIVEPVDRAGLLEVRFVKAKGDPLEWRRLFKRVTVLCRDAVVRPSGDAMVG